MGAHIGSGGHRGRQEGRAGEALLGDGGSRHPDEAQPFVSESGSFQTIVPWKIDSRGRPSSFTSGANFPCWIINSHVAWSRTLWPLPLTISQLRRTPSRSPTTRNSTRSEDRRV